MFDVNPNGMRSEAIYTDTDRQNWDWEGIWNAAARIDGEGWTAEVAIPVKTLSFDPASDAWGVNFTRWHGADNEQFGWVSYNRAQNLSRTGSMTGTRRPASRAWTRRGSGPARRRDARLRDRRRGRVPRAVARCVLEDHAVVDRRAHAQPRFLRHDRGHATDQPDALRPVLPGAARLLPAGFGHLRVRRAAARKAAFRSSRAASVSTTTARRSRSMPASKLTGRAGPLNVGVLGVRQDAADRAGVGGSLRRARRSERARGIERRRHRDERQSRPACRQLARGRRLPLPQHAPRTRTAASRRRRGTSRPTPKGSRATARRTAFGLAVPNSEGWNGRARLQGDRGELFPRAGFRRPDRFRRRPSPSSATPGGRRATGSDASRARSASRSSSRSIGSDRSREVELQLVEVENQAADYLDAHAHLHSRTSSRSRSRSRKAS